MFIGSVWQHVLYTHFICRVIAESNNIDKSDSDVSMKDTEGRIESDISFIDDRFENSDPIAPQILNYSLQTDEPKAVTFWLQNQDLNEPPKLDFHIDVPDANNANKEFNIGGRKLRPTPDWVDLGFLQGNNNNIPTHINTKISRRRMRFHNNEKEFRRIIKQDRPRPAPPRGVRPRQSAQKMSPGSKMMNPTPIYKINTTWNYPYIAAVIINGRLWCAGTLVDENWVLTAAHCLNFVLHVSPLKLLQNQVKVRLGSVHPHQGGKLHNVVGAVRHPKFEEEPVPHADVALLKLDKNVDLTRFINIIKIYQGEREPYAHSFIEVAGWGATRSGETAVREPTPDLTAGRLKVRTQSYCIDSYQHINDFQFTSDLFCASLRNGIRDACLYDAGAPAVQENMLMGIMSFGPEKCGSIQPAVFVKAFYFRDFVKATISSYKTTEELIRALQVMNNEIKPNPLSSTINLDQELERVTKDANIDI